jgi:hypothetical protein
VVEVTQALRRALQAEYVVLGGGNAKRLKKLPDGARLGDNGNAFLGGFRLWEDAPQRVQPKTPTISRDEQTSRRTSKAGNRAAQQS